MSAAEFTSPGLVPQSLAAGSTGRRDKRDAKMRHGLEQVFPDGHQYADRLYYDPREGQYYDAYSDWYISLDEAKAFGLPV